MPGTTGLDSGNVRCPRCGYDLRGTVATWDDVRACPLEGTCTECGLSFEWADIMNPVRSAPLWCVEYAPRRSFPRAWLATFLRTFLPWRFWSRLRMSHEIRWRRIAAYLLVLPLPGALAYVLAQSAAAWFVWGHVRAEIQVAAADHSALVQSVRQQLAWIEANVERPSEYPPDRVGDWDVLRQQQMQRLQTWIQRNDAGLLAYEVRHSRWRAMAEAIAAPLSRGSSGIVMIAGNQRSYPAPIELWSLVFNDLLGWGWSRRTFAVQNTAAVGGLLGVASFLMFPAAFILLPVSRRRAKVRWAHLGRIAAYGLILPPIVLLVACALLAVGGFDARFSGITARLLLLTSAFGAPLLGVIWWACATRCYLRMPHAWTMTALLWLAVWLVNLAALYWVLGDRLIEVFI